MAQWLRAYGDREGDGMVQMTFTLAVLPGDRAKEAARRFAESHGLRVASQLFHPQATIHKKPNPETGHGYAQF